MFSMLHVTYFSFQCNQYKTLSVSSENILRKGNWYVFCGWWNYSTELRMFSLLFGHQDTQPSSSLQTGYVTSICVFSSRGFRASLRLSTASGMTSGVCWPIKPPTGLGSLPTHPLNWAGGSSHFLLEAESQVGRAWLPEGPCGRPPQKDPKAFLCWVTEIFLE